MVVAQFVGAWKEVRRMVCSHLREAAAMEAVAARQMVPVVRSRRGHAMAYAGISRIDELARAAGCCVSVEADGAGRRVATISVVGRHAV